METSRWSIQYSSQASGYVVVFSSSAYRTLYGVLCGVVTSISEDDRRSSYRPSLLRISVGMVRSKLSRRRTS